MDIHSIIHVYSLIREYLFIIVWFGSSMENMICKLQNLTT